MNRQFPAGGRIVTRYRTIVADPPWEVGRVLGWGTTSQAALLPYPTMDVEDIAALPVRELAATDAHLYVWTINAYIEDTYRLQGLPDNWTQVPAGAPDSRRYAGLGDAVTANVGEWIGRRLLQVEARYAEAAA